jgi:5-methylcytosine-specific restriction endonuclease McrA
VRKLDHPLIDDAEVLQKLRRSRSGLAKVTAPYFPSIEQRYQAYRMNQGNPWMVAVDPTFLPLRTSLHTLYKKPPVPLSFIKSLRDSIQGACPVCGRDSIGTLDHYLPKADYAEYSFFSLNLVPACERCNNARNNLVQGANQGERPLHPYFDTFAERRIMTIKAEPDWRAPRLTPLPFNVVGEELTVIQWHIENVIRPAGIDGYLTNLWGSLVADPHPVLGTVATKSAVATELDRQVKINAGIAKSPNAWRSCFYFGLMTDDAALDYLVTLV